MSVFCPEIGEKVTYLTCQDCVEKSCREPKETFALLIVGSRNMTNYSLFKKETDRLIVDVREKYRILIVSGGARGADSLAERYAKENGFSLKVIPVKWNGPNDKAAGFRRNEQMHRFIAQYEHRGCIAFWNGTSPGTTHSFVLAPKYNNKLKVVRI